MNIQMSDILNCKLFLKASIFILSFFVFFCPGAQKKKKKGPPIEIVLKCDGSQGIREYIFRETDRILQRGVVLLPKKKTCSAARRESEFKIKSYKWHGPWKEFYKESGGVLAEGEYKGNKRVGLFKYFDKKGNRLRTVQYEKGKKHGPEVTYFAGTDIWRKKGENKNGKKTGLWQKKSNREGSCVSRGNYREGFKEGPWEGCGKDQKTKKYYVSFKGTYRNGARTGNITLYHNNGKVLGNGRYRVDRSCLKKTPRATAREKKCGKRTGRWVIYHNNGNKAMEGSYASRSGLKTGIWREFYKSGQKMASGKRKHTRIGEWTFWEKSGKVKGKFKFKGSDVSIQGGTTYKNGRKTAESLPGEGCRKRKNLRGKMIMRCRISSGSFLAGIAKYDIKKDELKFILRMKQGRWAYYKNGQKSEMGECSTGRKTGVWKIKRGGSWITKTYRIMDGQKCK